LAISHDDRRFLLLCEEVKKESYDPHRKVGVVVVGPSGVVLADGVNAPPQKMGISLSAAAAAISHDASWKYFMFEHAERAAIFAARDKGASLVGATMYGTLFPCADCARAIVSAGILRLVISAADEDPIRDERWRDHYRFAQEILKLGKVTVEIVPQQSLV